MYKVSQKFWLLVLIAYPISTIVVKDTSWKEPTTFKKLIEGFAHWAWFLAYQIWTPIEYQANLLFAKSLHMILISNENWKTWCVPGVGWKKIRSRLYFLRHTIYIVQYNTWGPNIYYRCTYKSVTIIMVLALHVSDSLLKKH